MSRLLKSQDYLMKSLGFVLLFGFISLGAIGGCNNDGSSSEPNLQVRALIVAEFTEADINDDGVLSDDEIQGKIKRDFDNADRDKDGELTALDHEGPEYNGNTVTAINRGELVCDSNGDEVVTFEEYSDCTNQNFVEPMDVDKNGVLTLEEVLDFWGFKLN
ncbi:MAG: hypothetical protein IH964_11675 [Candidatus Dadabacteria bacterium]|nr:hypothetical protein [Candidatus Dadabacteria bacterium]